MYAIAERIELAGPSILGGLEFGETEEKLRSGERERLIVEHLPQVRRIARRIRARLPDHLTLDDLVSSGTLGLISAIDGFDSSRNIQLKTYAEHKIQGAILDSLRRLDWAPRLQRKRAKQMVAALAASEQRLQRVPGEEEIAAELNLTLDTYHQWQLEISGLNLARLESFGSEDAEDRDLLRVLSDDAGEWPSAVFERKELQSTLAQATAALPAMEKTVLSLYYRDELTLREIAKIFTLHESRISQLKAQAILRLRVSMAKLWPASGCRLQAA